MNSEAPRSGSRSGSWFSLPLPRFQPSERPITRPREPIKAGGLGRSLRPDMLHDRLAQVGQPAMKEMSGAPQDRHLGWR